MCYNRFIFLFWENARFGSMYIILLCTCALYYKYNKIRLSNKHGCKSNSITLAVAELVKIMAYLDAQRGAMVVLRGKNYQGTKNLAIKCTQLKRT